MTLNPPQHFTIVDPRQLAGNPFEVADRAVGQVFGIAELLHLQLDAAELMGRNAFLERQARNEEPIDAEKWYASAEYRSWLRVKQQVASARGTLRVLQESSSFDPKRPPKERL